MQTLRLRAQEREELLHEARSRATELLEAHRDTLDALAAELQAWCEGRLAHYKWPRSIDFDAQLPRLDNGKLYKTALRERYWEGRASRVV